MSARERGQFADGKLIDRRVSRLIMARFNDDTQLMVNYQSDNTSTAMRFMHVNAGLSAANRRLYKQCRSYTGTLKLSRFTPAGGGDNAIYKVYTLSNAWWVSEAIKFAKTTYKAEARSMKKRLGRGLAKWNDFIIEIESGAHVMNPYQNFQTTSDEDGDMTETTMTYDENIITNGSRLQRDNYDADGSDGEGDYVTFTLSAASTNSTSTQYNIFDQYLLKMPVFTNDELQDDRVIPYAELHQVDEVLGDELQDKGDEPPWDADALPGPWTHVATIGHDGDSMGSFSTGKLEIPLGIVIIQKFDNSNAAANFTVDDTFSFVAKSGSYQGVHAPTY